MKKYLMAGLLLLAGCASQTKQPAQYEMLRVGSVVPFLEIQEYIKGTPPHEPEHDILSSATYKTDHVYVIDFGATWCGPCVGTIDKLNELQKAHQNELVIISMYASEQDTSYNKHDKLDNLKKFIKNWHVPIEYRVVYDDSGISWKNWMTASGNGGIPVAFIVSRTGKITWIGHPGLDDFDKAVESELNH